MIRQYTNEIRIELQVVFFTNSGTEANELAMMMARLYTDCHDIISLRNAYHGNASGTMAATAQSNWKFNVVQVPSIFTFYHLNIYNKGKRTNLMPQMYL